MEERKKRNSTEVRSMPEYIHLAIHSEMQTTMDVQLNHWMEEAE